MSKRAHDTALDAPKSTDLLPLELLPLIASHFVVDTEGLDQIFCFSGLCRAARQALAPCLAAWMAPLCLAAEPIFRFCTYRRIAQPRHCAPTNAEYMLAVLRLVCCATQELALLFDDDNSGIKPASQQLCGDNVYRPGVRLDCVFYADAQNRLQPLSAHPGLRVAKLATNTPDLLALHAKHLKRTQKCKATRRLLESGAQAIAQAPGNESGIKLRVLLYKTMASDVKLMKPWGSALLANCVVDGHHLFAKHHAALRERLFVYYEHWAVDPTKMLRACDLWRSASERATLLDTDLKSFFY